MIAAIADDLTGATEIGGVGWRFGLTTEIIVRGTPSSQSDLIVYDTDSRLGSAREAVRRVGQITRSVQESGPAWIYKKVDSVLRGHVLTELDVICRRLGFAQCLLVPANPKAGRLIRDGKYFIHGVPLSRTDFRNDPAHPRRSCFIKRLLARSGPRNVTLLESRTHDLPDGISIGQAETVADLRHWATRAGKQFLPAGGAAFFEALLRARTGVKALRAPSAPRRAARTLIVTGSTAKASADFIERRRREGWPVCLMPPALARGKTDARLQTQWVRDIAESLQKHQHVIVAIGQPLRRKMGEGQRMGKVLATTVGDAVAAIRPDRLCLEGGATAALVMKQLGISRLRLTCEYASGIAGVEAVGATSTLARAPQVELVVKPGSYPWPEDLWR